MAKTWIVDKPDLKTKDVVADIYPEMPDFLLKKADASGLKNIEPRLVKPTEPFLALR